MPKTSAVRRSSFWWPIVKTVLALAIIFFIGRQFARDLASGDALNRIVDCRIGWLVIGGVAYLAGLGMSLVFWFLLLKRLHQRPAVIAAIRAYYIGHMGKYLPGKAWALMLRAGLVQSNHVRPGIAVASSLYEVLTTMTGGVLLAVAVVLATLTPHAGMSSARAALRSLLRLSDPGVAVLDRNVLLGFAVILLAIVGLPTVPPVYTRLVARISLPFRRVSKAEAPRFDWTGWGQGLILTSIGWLMLGLSLWAVINALVPNLPSLTFVSCCQYTAFLALAYVAGFVIIFVPSGLGVREFFLQLFLAQQFIQSGMPDSIARENSVLAVVLLRIVWTTSEVIIVSLVYWLPGTSISGVSAIANAGIEETP